MVKLREKREYIPTRKFKPGDKYRPEVMIVDVDEDKRPIVIFVSGQYFEVEEDYVKKVKG